MQRLLFPPFLSALSMMLAGSAAVAQPVTEPRRLAPGVLTEIEASPLESETFTGPVALRKLPTVDFTPHFSPKAETLHERAKFVTFRRPIWNLDFAFKPLRMVVASIPQPTGKLDRRTILYMVYRIRNNGQALQQTEQPDRTYKAETVPVSSLGNNKTPRFLPHFVVVGTYYDEQTQKYQQDEYLDRVMPGALPAILDREIIPPSKPMLMDSNGDPVAGPDGKPLILLNTAQITQVHPIPVTTETDDNSVWGVVTWEIDARVDYVTIYIQGLTNAFQRRVSVDGKVTYEHKTLQLNFWRPGDNWEEAQDPVYYGVPLVKNPGKQIEILNFYKVPGPTLSVYETVEVAETPAVAGGTGEKTNLHRHLVDVQVPVNSQLEVPVRNQLDDPGNLPGAVRTALASVGVAIPDGTRVTTETPKNMWHFTATVDGKKRLFRLIYQPQYWDAFNGGVEFQERVEHLWVYR